MNTKPFILSTQEGENIKYVARRLSDATRYEQNIFYLSPNRHDAFEFDAVYNIDIIKYNLERYSYLVNLTEEFV